MEPVRCHLCQLHPFETAGSFYLLSDLTFLCKANYDSAPDQFSVLFDIYDDYIVQNLASIQRTLKEVYEKGYGTGAVDFLYQQLGTALEMRANEWRADYTARSQEANEDKEEQPAAEICVPPASSADAPPDDSWKCRHCDFANFASNPICYQCRTPQSSDSPSVPHPFPVALFDYDLTTGVTNQCWRCSRCNVYNPSSAKNCACGFVNLQIVSSAVLEEPEPPKEQQSLPAVSPVSTMSWACACGYGYNLKTSNTCLKCKAPIPAAVKAELNKCSKCCVKEADEGKKLCSDCEQSRKQLEKGRKKCAVCDTELPQDGKPCLTCRKPEVSLPVKKKADKLQLIQPAQKSVLSSRRFCRKCGAELEGTRPCSACLKKKEEEEKVKSGQKKTKSSSKGGKPDSEQHK